MKATTRFATKLRVQLSLAGRIPSHVSYLIGND